MATIELKIDNALPLARLHIAPNGGADAPAGSGAATRGIMMLAPDSRELGSLVEAITRVQAVPDAPRLVVVLERATDAIGIAELNVDGMVVSSPEVRRFLECIESVASGERWVDPVVQPLVMSTSLLKRHSLTKRERQIAEGVIRGLRNKEIAREIGVRETTVKMHLHHMFEKFKVASRTQFALAYSSPDRPNGARRRSRARH
jgi:DNA-binding NarL/FixJ family response regulator